MNLKKMLLGGDSDDRISLAKEYLKELEQASEVMIGRFGVLAEKYNGKGMDAFTVKAMAFYSIHQLHESFAKVMPTQATLLTEFEEAYRRGETKTEEGLIKLSAEVMEKLHGGLTSQDKRDIEEARETILGGKKQEEEESETPFNQT